jgi:hypothetical protein
MIDTVIKWEILLWASASGAGCTTLPNAWASRHPSFVLALCPLGTGKNPAEPCPKPARDPEYKAF